MIKLVYHIDRLNEEKLYNSKIYDALLVTYGREKASLLTFLEFCPRNDPLYRGMWCLVNERMEKVEMELSNINNNIKF